VAILRKLIAANKLKKIPTPNQEDNTMTMAHNQNGSDRAFCRRKLFLDCGSRKATLIPTMKNGGILDHEFIDAAEGVWHVTARVVPVGPSKSVYTTTLPNPKTCQRTRSRLECG
jgi:hypothetical protein